MKKFFILIISILIVSVNSFAKDALEWNLTYDKFCKKVSIEKKFEDENYTVVFLPKDSIYNNNFDEYLLSEKNGKKKVLTRILESVPYGKNDCVKYAKDKYGDNLLYSNQLYYNSNSGIGFFNKKLWNYFYKYYFTLPSAETKLKDFYNMVGMPSFPSKYSPEVIFLTKIKNLSSFDDAFFDSLYCGFVFLDKNSSYIITQNTQSNSESDDLDSIIKEVVNYTLKKEPQNIDELLQKSPAPFGLAWGLESDNLSVVTTKFEKVDYEDRFFTSEGKFLRDNIHYSNYYDCYKIDKTEIFSLEPKESENEIPFYFAFFDSYNGLYQLFTVPFYSLSYEEDIFKCISSNKSEYEEIKRILSEKYGQPTIKNNAFVYWQLDNGVKIDLFIESKKTTVYDKSHKDGVLGNEDYTCLVYTNTTLYEKTKERLKKQKEDWEKWLSE